MCISSENFSLQLISFTCLLILVVDSVVLAQTIDQYKIFE